jgi:hypothetical protein
VLSEVEQALFNGDMSSDLTMAAGRSRGAVE